MKLPYRCLPAFVRAQAIARARRGGPVAAALFGSALAMSVAPTARAQGLFTVSRGANATLLSVNTANGQATPIGRVGAPVVSLTASASFLLGGTSDGNLVRIDPTSGATTLLGFSGSANPIFGLSLLSGSLYGIQGALGGIVNLVSLNSATGAASVLGQITDGTNFPAARGLTVFNGQLLTADAGLGAGGDLFSLNPANGFATSLTASSATGIPINGLRSLDAIGGTLYALNDDPTDPNVSRQTGLALYRINPATAQTTLVAPVNLVPEPGTLALAAGAALTGAPLLLLRRRRRPTRRPARRHVA